MGGIENRLVRKHASLLYQFKITEYTIRIITDTTVNVNYMQLRIPSLFVVRASAPIVKISSWTRSCVFMIFSLFLFYGSSVGVSKR